MEVRLRQSFALMAMVMYGEGMALPWLLPSLYRLTLVEKSLLVAHHFGICVAHMGCATNATPLITVYWWRISICATHMLNISGAYSICAISVLCVAHIAICATNT
jgi:hypothetical protein